MAADADLLAHAERRVGTVLCGKYRIERVLGVGGMAAVYVATHRMQKQFALKVLHPELSLRKDIRERFLREGLAANSVRHPGVVAVIDNDTAEDGSPFLIMELLEGAVLETIWEKFGPAMTVRQVMAIGDEVLEVLAAAHARDIVHRDIKPLNLFVTSEGRVKVLDFGIARVRDAAASLSGGTQTGTLLGTPAFMAPEQALAETSKIDGRTDLWGLAATMFLLLSGKFVHEAPNGAQVAIKAATTPARSLASVAPGIAPELVAVIDRALAFDRDARWASAAEMRDALASAHEAMFGAPIDRGAVRALWEEVRDAFPPPSVSPGAITFPAGAPATPGGTPRAQDSFAARATEPATPVVLTGDGGTTAQPVSNRPAAGVTPATQGRRAFPSAAVLAVVVGALAAATGGVVLLTRAPAPPVAATASGATPPAASPAAAVVAPASAPQEVAAAPVASAAVSPTRTAVAPVRAVPKGQPAPRASAPAGGPAAAPAGSASSGAPCRIVTEYDADGQPHFKKVCP